MSTEIFDLEVYINFFYVAFRDVDTQDVTTFVQTDDEPLDLRGLKARMRQGTVVSFNGKRFDAPLLALALTGAKCAQLKAAANDIINNNLQPWQFEDRWRCKIPQDWDHIDIFDVAPGMTSLKIYAGRLHCKRLQDLPVAFDATLTPEEMQQVGDYCANSDTVATLDLYRKLLPQIALRTEMTKQYGIDLRSKSDAQIAEAVIKSEVTKITGQKVERPVIAVGTQFLYRAPFFVSFTDPHLRHALDTVTTAPFEIIKGGSVVMPKELKDLKITIGSSTYQMGIGGLHSTESCVTHLADESTLLIDRDVASYYPSIILGCNLYPKHMGAAFTRVYRKLVQRRLDAKHSGDKVTADALKITINGSFGKLGSMWSALYSPDLLIQTTITGQLCLLMLIEMLEAEGIPVVSANTDGVVIKCPVARQADMVAVVATWETCTGFDTEDTHYRALHSRDVNNYVAIKTDNTWKAKGAYAPAGLAKNPTNEVCAEAVRKYLVDGTAVDATITGCTDIRKFLTLRQVNGGAVDQGGKFLGRAARWYYSTQVEGPIRYKVNGYTVARSEAARALMTLPDSIPTDLDRAWYVREAYSILSDVGAAPI